MKKNYYSIFFLLAFITASSLTVNAASPINDFKAGAISVMNCSSTLYSNEGAGLDLSGGSCGQFYGNVWFKYAATGTSVYVAIGIGTIKNPAVAMMNASGTVLKCATVSGGYLKMSVLGLTVGQTYYITVFNASTVFNPTPGIDDQGSFAVCVDACYYENVNFGITVKETCPGQTNGSVKLNGSELGILYDLGTTTLTGTGSALTWSNLPAGPFAIKARRSYSCVSPTTVATGSVPSVPIYIVGGGGSYCSGGSGLGVGINGSRTNVNYQLKINGINSGSPRPGSGSGITWSGQTTAGTYTVAATDLPTNCTQMLNGSAVISIIPLPALFTISGGGNLCSGRSTVSVTLNGSEAGVNYQLKNGSINNGSPIPGTGSAITWPAPLTVGTYTIIATNSSTGCTLIMPGSASVIMNSSSSFSVAEFINKPGQYCGYDTLILQSSDQGVNYQLQRAGILQAGTIAPGTGSKLKWWGKGFSGSYSVIANDVACGTSATSAAIETICQFSDVVVDEKVTISSGPLSSGNYALVVSGDILTGGLNVKPPAQWPDYVFDRNYPLTPLSKVENFIRLNGHLPNIPSAQKINEMGSYSIGEMDAVLLEKIEELTLYLIDLQQKSSRGKKSSKENGNKYGSPSLIKERSSGSGTLRTEAIMNWRKKNEQNYVRSETQETSGFAYSIYPLPSYGSALISGILSIASSKSVSSNYNLVVAGNTLASGIDVKAVSNWPDYVFADDYTLPTIEGLEKYIKSNRHLPGIPSANQMQEVGIYNAAEIDALLLEKIEWLTLYAIQLQRKAEGFVIKTETINEEEYVVQEESTSLNDKTNSGSQNIELTETLSAIRPIVINPSMTFDNVTITNSLCIACNIVPPGFNLAVGGNILAASVDIKVPQTWPDYVFAEDYKLMSLRKVNRFIRSNGHLPNVSSYSKMKEQINYSVTDMDVKLLEKIEELALHIINLNKEVSQSDK